jgi:hypothetical protein
MDQRHDPDTSDGQLILETYFSRISGDGTEIIDDLRVTTAYARADRTAIEWTGSEFALVWADNRTGNFEVYFARITPLGVKDGGDAMVTTASELYSRWPALSSGSEGIGIAYINSEMPHFALVTVEGTLIGSPFQVSTQKGNDYPAILWSGEEFGYVWKMAPEGLFFNRIGPCD